MTLHNLLSNAELHEQKGVSTASTNTMYWSDGAGSGDWFPLINTAGSENISTATSEVEFTDLDNYCFLQIDLVGISLSSGTDQNILLQVGDDSGYTTSSVYYQSYWSSNTENSSNNTGLVIGYFKNNVPANSTINGSSTFITNFNVERTVVGSNHTFMDDFTTEQSSFQNRVLWIREKKAYNKIKILPDSSDNFTGGSIVVTGFRYYP